MMNLFHNPLVLSLAYLLLRMLFIPLSPVPSAVVLDPLWVFAVLLNAQGGRRWVLSLLPALLLGDWMGGLPWPQIVMRSGGFVLLAQLPVKGGFNRQCLFWITQHGLWSSVMPDWLGFYPLGYLYGIWMLQGVLWWGLLIPQKKESGGGAWWSLLSVPLLLLLAHFIFTSPAFWPVPQLGSHSGWGIRILGGLLLVPGLAAYLPRRRTEVRAVGGGSSRGRWTHLAD